MNLKKMTFLAGAAAALTGGQALAQSDSQVWMEAGVSGDLGDDLEASFEQHLRFDQDVSRVESVMPELGLEYEVSDWLQFEGGYRFEYERDGDDELAVRHRLHLDGEAELEMEYVSLAYRLRYQRKVRSSNDQRQKVRNRVGAAFEELERWKPEASVEAFHERASDPTRGIVLEKVRITAGTEYDFGKPEVDLWYRIELPYDERDDPIVHIFGLGFHQGL